MEFLVGLCSRDGRKEGPPRGLVAGEGEGAASSQGLLSSSFPPVEPMRLLPYVSNDSPAELLLRRWCGSSVVCKSSCNDASSLPGGVLSPEMFVSSVLLLKRSRLRILSSVLLSESWDARGVRSVNCCILVLKEVGKLEGGGIVVRAARGFGIVRPVPVRLPNLGVDPSSPASSSI